MSGAEPEEPPIRFKDNRKIDPLTGKARTSADGATAPSADGDAGGQGTGPDAGTDAGPDTVPDDASSLTGAGTDENALLLEERTRDLQRLSAEYANYRRRAERERLAAGEVAVGRTLAELIPVVDDLDRAKAHGDLTGALKAVADKLDAAFGKLGLVAFGEVGDAFDPSLHEAVLHDESDTVDVATCTAIMRVGYRHGERLLRPAMVGVTAPSHPSPPAAQADNAEAPADTAEDASEGDHASPPGEPAN